MNNVDIDSPPLVSVVTPVYNGAAYLEECIESVVRQTYTNWEHTIVDNASTDETADIAARYARRESRVRHLRFEEHVDSNTNHNRAFRAISADSEYCKVVQADDWIYPECLERMVEIGESAETIGIVGAYRLWDTKVDLVGLHYQKSVFAGHDVLRQALLGGPYVTGAPTALLYRSRLIRERDPFFERGFMHDDTDAAYWALTKYDFGYAHRVLTFARQQAGAQLEWVGLMNTYLPENVRFTLRYGPVVFAPDQYRRQLRSDLKTYVSFHLRQLPKPSRLANPDFFAIHRAEVEKIREEAHGDPEVRAAMSVITALLLREPRGRTPSARATLD